VRVWHDDMIVYPSTAEKINAALPEGYELQPDLSIRAWVLCGSDGRIVDSFWPEELNRNPEGITQTAQKDASCLSHP
jgi:hypothetical protein